MIVRNWIEGSNLEKKKRNLKWKLKNFQYNSSVDFHFPATKHIKKDSPKDNNDLNIYSRFESPGKRGIEKDSVWKLTTGSGKDPIG